MYASSLTKALVIWIFLLAPSAGRADEGGAAEPADTPTPVGQPYLVVDLSGVSSVQGFLFSQDGTELYLDERQDAVNAWALAVHYWPEWAVSGLLALTAGVAVAAVRWWRRPTFGVAHCRCCEYCLDGLTSDRCPECGADLLTQPPLRGRRQRRPPLLRLTGVSLAWCVLIGLILWGPGRENAASTWLEWWSPALLEWSKSKGWKAVTDLGTKTSRLAVRDTSSGRFQRVLGISGNGGLSPQSTSPDGKVLITHDSRQREFICLDTRSGRALRRVDYSAYTSAWGPGTVTARWAMMCQDVVFVLLSRASDGREQLLRIDLATGEAHSIYDGDSPSTDRPPREFHVVYRPEPTMVLVRYTGSGPGYQEPKAVLSTLAPDAPPAPVLAIPKGAWGRMLLSSDGREAAMACSGSAPGLILWDLEAPDGYDMIPFPEGCDPRDRHPLCRCGDNIVLPLACGSAPDCERVLGIMNARAGRCAATLAYPPEAVACQPHRIAASPDGGLLAAVCIKDTGGGPVRGQVLVLWRLPELDHSPENGWERR